MHDYSLFDHFDLKGHENGVYQSEAQRWIGGKLEWFVWQVNRRTNH